MVGYVMGGALILAVVFWIVWETRRKKRLERLAESMERYLSGDEGPLSFSLREDTVALVENAAAELENRVEVEKERLNREARRTSDLTADISHQLKTPLSSLRLFVEMDEGPHLNQQLGQIERMETMIGSLLRLEKLCADGYEFHWEERSLRPLIDQAWRRLSPLWPQKRLTVEGDARLRCDEKWLEEAFGNLLKNACEHTAPDGCVSIRLEQGERTVYCTVEDDGGGVKPEELPHLFERFYRAENQSGHGAGLGLAIVREIVYRHHGHILAENGKKGLKFTLSLPMLRHVNPKL